MEFDVRTASSLFRDTVQLTLSGDVSQISSLDSLNKQTLVAMLLASSLKDYIINHLQNIVTQHHNMLWNDVYVDNEISSYILGILS